MKLTKNRKNRKTNFQMLKHNLISPNEKLIIFTKYREQIKKVKKKQKKVKRHKTTTTHEQKHTQKNGIKKHKRM